MKMNAAYSEEMNFLITLDIYGYLSNDTHMLQ